MRHNLALLLAVSAACLAPGALAAEPASKSPSGGPSAIRHRFLALDRSRSQLVHVDQTDASKDWTMAIPVDCRDFQLIGSDNILFSTKEGYAEYSLTTRTLLSKRKVQGFPLAMFARRLPNGRTMVGGYQKGVAIRELDAYGKVLRTLSFPAFSMCRVGRFTPEGTLLFGADNRLVETDRDGRIVKVLAVPDSRHIYQALKKPGGHLLVSTGYGVAVAELDAEGKVLRVFGGKQAPEAKELGYYFFAGFQVLRNGHIVVTNWTGFDPDDSVKGAQLIEFDGTGKVVWKWHDPVRAGCVHGVIVLDDLDTKVLNDDTSSVLGPVKCPPAQQRVQSGEDGIRGD